MRAVGLTVGVLAAVLVLLLWATGGLDNRSSRRSKRGDQPIPDDQCRFLLRMASRQPPIRRQGDILSLRTRPTLRTPAARLPILRIQQKKSFLTSQPSIMRSSSFGIHYIPAILR